MRTPVIVGLAAAGCLAIGLANSALQGGWDVDGALAGSRITSRWAFVFFIAAFSASSLAKLWPGGWRTALLRRRRGVGLSFAASHFVHAGFFLTAIFVFGAERSLITFIFGGLAYLFIAAMAATSNDASVKTLGPRRWKLLHQVGGWYIVFIFANSYVGRLVGDKPLLGAFGTGLIVLAVGLRIAAALKGRSRLQAA
jgi:sulfoxide reductase heme-binding subunit YedZ